MNRPAISVCVITYNQRDYIRQCLESVLAQRDAAPMEILVGDDCSNDGTSEIVAEIAAAHSGVVKHLRHAARVGATTNAKTVLRAATGELIAHLDGDDYWLPGKLKAQIAYLQVHPDCSAVYTNAIAVNRNGERIGLFNDAGAGRFSLADMLRRGNFLNTSSVLVRAELRTLVLDIDGDFIDYRAHLRYARNGYLAQLATPLAAYRVNAVGAMTSVANDTVRKLYWDAILDVPRERVSPNDFAHGIADFLRRVGLHALRTRRWPLIRDWAAKAFAASPYGHVRTAMLTIASAVRALTIISIRGTLQRLRGNRDIVLHRR